jgi:peptide/nickel transport system substrate-binding protein
MNLSGRARRRSLALGCVALAGSVALAACGSSSSGSGGTKPSSGGTTGGGKQGGTLKALVGTAPDSLDPGFGYTTQALEGDNMVYTPLLSYVYKEGTAGTVLMPGLATALPTVSADKLTYTATLRSGLKYSDGTAVKASDVKYGIQRSIKISWGGKSFFTGYIKGAKEYDAGKATDISGITADDTTGKITFTLTKPYGAFDNLLAFVAAAPVPSTTPLKVLSNNPPVGIGPYKFGKIVPNASYQLIKNTSFASNNIPGIPTGFLNEVDVTVNSNTQTEAQQVLDNTADVFDPADTLPASLVSQVQAQKDRYSKEELASTYYYFFNTKVKPFNNAAARQAVDMSIDRTAISRLSSGSLTPACYFLPPPIIGHVSDACTFGQADQVPSDATIAKAKKMISDAGLAGTKVTVWSQTRSPRQEFMSYLNDLLNKLGFKSSLKVIQDSVYFQTIGNQSLYPQVGFADWSQDFPNPSDFYLLLATSSIQATNNENFGNVSDPKIDGPLATLEQVPSSQLQSQASGWQDLDKYVASQSYVGVFGYETAPKFLSTRVDFASAVFNPVSYLEFNTVSLK